MTFARDLLKRVVDGKATATEVVTEIKAVAPLGARLNRDHWWWYFEGADLLAAIEDVATGKALISVQDAVREAFRIHGKVMVSSIAGVEFYRVLPVAKADKILSEQIVCEALPAEMVDPPWDDELPELVRFRFFADRQYLRRLLEKYRWNLTAAAREAGVTRQCLYHLANRRGLQRPA